MFILPVLMLLVVMYSNLYYDVSWFNL